MGKNVAARLRERYAALREEYDELDNQYIKFSREEHDSPENSKKLDAIRDKQSILSIRMAEIESLYQELELGYEFNKNT